MDVLKEGMFLAEMASTPSGGQERDTRTKPLRQVNVASEGVQLDPGSRHSGGEEVMAAGL